MNERATMEKHVFWDFLLHNDDGERCGIADDAPEYAKKSYAEYLAEEQRKITKGIKVKKDRFMDRRKSIKQI